VNLILFYVLAAMIIISGFMVVTLRNVFHSALFLVLTFFTVAGIYLMLSAEFLAAVQVLIYVGAVTILMLFAIMLTYHIQSASVRQVNEQVIPATIISAIFLALAIFAVTRTFAGIGPAARNTGAWTAAIDSEKLIQAGREWNWTATLEDKAGTIYIPSGLVAIVPQNAVEYSPVEPESEQKYPYGYILSPNADFSTRSKVFSDGQTIYLKVWSEQVDYRSVTEAEWRLTSQIPAAQTVTLKLSNSNTETIGRLMMSKFVLPFEVVSVLLLVALIGAIVISRKDK
jgi:NADH:ubiquinone oxidoreductase subunit 6 (subunit J)